MLRIKGKGAEYGEVWFDEEPEYPLPDILILRQRASVPFGLPTRQFTSLANDLQVSEETLFKSFAKGTRYEIRRASTSDSLDWKVTLAPTRDEISDFVSFYDKFAAGKGIARADLHWLTAAACAASLQLTGALVENELLVAHAYLVVGARVRLVYSASHLREADGSRRSLIGRANRWLHWRDMCHFKELTLASYDWGGLFDDELDPTHVSVDRFKKEFGGVSYQSYNATYPLSNRGRIYLAMRSGWLHVFPRRDRTRFTLLETDEPA